MMYLSGCITQTLLADVRADVGLMLQPGMGNFSAATLPLQFRLWAGDNGRFARPDEWVAGDWLEWAVGLRRYRSTCRFIVAPDVVGDAVDTLRMSLPYLPTIGQLGFIPAFVSQDGARSALIPWDEFGVLFVGGTDAWKFSEASLVLVREAQRRGKKTHVGRVNTMRRLRAGLGTNADTVDGTYLKYGPDTNWPRLCTFLDEVNSGQIGLAA
jgi:hypothetical protein